MPPEYGVPLPQPQELPAPMAATVDELREHPAGRLRAADVPRGAPAGPRRARASARRSCRSPLTICAGT